MNKLISMTDFVLKTHDEISDSIDSESMMFNYANFLKRPLTLGMFVPCDEDGNVLQEKSIFNTTDEDYIFYSESFDNYKKAEKLNCKIWFL